VTLIEENSEVAVNEILSLLKSRVARFGACQITNRTISKILTDRFGFSNQVRTRTLTKFVIEYLLKSGTIELWDSKPACIIYNINPAQVRNYLLDSEMITQ